MHSEGVSTSQQSVYKSGAHQSVSVLSKTSAIALLGNGLTCIIEFLIAFTSVDVNWIGLLPLLIFAFITLISAGLILMHVSGTQKAGIVVSFLTFLYLNVPATRSGLLHPAASVLHFGLLVATFAFALVAIVTGIAATMPRFHGSAQRAPGWLLSFISGVFGLVVGMIVIASLVGATPQSSSTNTTTNGMPTVHTIGGHFLTSIVQVPKGARLVITNDDGVEHIIQNGSWTANSTPQPQTEPGAPVVSNLDLKEGSTTIGPFATAGIFHLYCPVHRGMNLTVVVQ